VGVYFEDAVNNGVRVKYSPTPLSNISLGELRSIIQELNNVSDRL